MPRPNIMWLWSAITLVIIGYWIFNNEESAPVKSDWAAVEQMVADGDVEAQLLRDGFPEFDTRCVDAGGRTVGSGVVIDVQA